jgi:hypothetical protein
LGLVLPNKDVIGSNSCKALLLQIVRLVEKWKRILDKLKKLDGSTMERYRREQQLYFNSSYLLELGGHGKCGIILLKEGATNSI